MEGGRIVTHFSIQGAEGRWLGAGGGVAPALCCSRSVVGAGNENVRLDIVARQFGCVHTARARDANLRGGIGVGQGYQLRGRRRGDTAAHVDSA